MHLNFSFEDPNGPQSILRPHASNVQQTLHQRWKELHHHDEQETSLVAIVSSLPQAFSSAERCQEFVHIAALTHAFGRSTRMPSSLKQMNLHWLAASHVWTMRFARGPTMLLFLLSRDIKDKDGISVSLHVSLPKSGMFGQIRMACTWTSLTQRTWTTTMELECVLFLICKGFDVKSSC